MPRKKHKNKKDKLLYLQGHLVSDSETVLCSTDRYKTSFAIKQYETGREIQCVHWAFCHPIKKDQLVIMKGSKINNVFIAWSITKIQSPYTLEVKNEC